MIARVFALIHDNCTHHFVSTVNQLDRGLCGSGAFIDQSIGVLTVHESHFQVAHPLWHRPIYSRSCWWSVTRIGVLTMCSNENCGEEQSQSAAFFTFVGEAWGALVDINSLKRTMQEQKSSPNGAIQS
jgi:hypothetical protein